jgi:penicillin-binding protein 2
MNKYKKRSSIVIAIFTLVSCIFIIQLFRIQIVNDKYKFSAKNNAFRYDILNPVRGLILDRDSNLIVSNSPSYNLMVIPRETKEMDTLNLCKMIDINLQDFRDKIINASNYSKYKESIFQKQINLIQASGLQEKLFQFPGFFLQTINTRKYATNSGAHLLGYLGEVNTKKIKEDNYYNNGDLAGLQGIEGGYEKELRGQKGMGITLVDVHNRKQGKFNDGKFDTLPIRGNTIISTIDINLQEYGEKLMQNKIGAIVAIEPNTGEILSLISAPTYNPNILSGRSRSKEYNKLVLDKNKPLVNRALTGQYPPGSTFKILNGLIALEENVIPKNTRYSCLDGFEYEKGKKVGCHPHEKNTKLNKAIEISCNAYFCKAFTETFKKFNSTQDAYDRWRNHLSSFGIGEWMNNDFVTGTNGMLPEKEYFDKYYGRKYWNASTIISMAIGQGELLLTPIQMANITAIIANRGYYYTPHIVKNIEKEENIDSLYREKKYTTISEKNFEIIIEGMEQVVKNPKGTAHNVFNNKIEICGKTGTAQNPHGEDHSIFIAFAPKENPKIAIAVYIENGGWGSKWAAPISSLMIEKYLNIETNKLLEEFIINGNLITKK